MILLVVLQGRAAHLLRPGDAGVGVTSSRSFCRTRRLTAFARPVNAAPRPASWRSSAWQPASGAVGILPALGVLLLLGTRSRRRAIIITRSVTRDPRLVAPPPGRLGLGSRWCRPLIGGGDSWFRLDPGAASGTARLARIGARRSAAGGGGDPHAGMPGGALAGHDVFVIFVESYGRTTLDTPSYRATTEAVLRGAGGRSWARGGSWPARPSDRADGGRQSWFAPWQPAFGAAADSEGRYRALLASPRKTLPRLATESWLAHGGADAGDHARPARGGIFRL